MKKTPSRLAIARIAYGLSQPELAELAGVGVSTLRQLEQGVTSPHYRQTGEWKDASNLLSAALAVSCDELWPMNDEEASRFSVELENQDEVAPPDRELDRSELRSYVDITLANLSDQERIVMLLRFGLGGTVEDTLTGTADKLSADNPEGRAVTRERVRSLEARALRKLRTPKSTPKP